MALLGAQLVMTLVMVSVIQKFSPHYSLAKWILCSTGLIRYLHPTDNELKTLAGVPKTMNKNKKDHRHKYGNGNDDRSHTFHVPRNLDIQLEVTKVTPFDVVNLRYYTEYQWLVDFSLYASIIYVISEVYHFYIPLKEEVNLSMMWCLLVVFFAFKLLISLTVQYFKSDESIGERSTCIVTGCVYLLVAMIVLIVDENTLEVGLEQAYKSFNESASQYLETRGVSSSGPASKIIVKFCIAVSCGVADAPKELRTEFEKLNFAEIEETFTDSVSQWRFNPPLAAHMGGSWERMIRTVKSIMKKTMPTRTPTQKMFETYLVEAEYIINSRPLTYVHLDHLEDEILTPNHFLLGSSGGVRAPGKFDETHLLKDDWKAVQHMTDLFWRRFNVEYLPTLTRRTKWFKEVKPIEVGDLVIIVDDKHERNTWPKGIVEEVFPGRGNRVRQARVRLIRGRDNLAKIDVKKIKHQSLVRPVAKLAVLDVAGVGKDKLSSSSEAVNGRENVKESNSAGRMDQ